MTMPLPAPPGARRRIAAPIAVLAALLPPAALEGLPLLPAWLAAPHRPAAPEAAAALDLAAGVLGALAAAGTGLWAARRHDPGDAEDGAEPRPGSSLRGVSPPGGLG